jgi:hypothetical protein
MTRKNSKPSSFEGMRITGGSALLIRHCAIEGTITTPIREYGIGSVEPHAQYPVSVAVSFIEHGKRASRYITIIPNNLRYLIIEDGDKLLYDSRIEIPCDMVEFQATKTRFKPSISIRHVRSEVFGPPGRNGGAA